MNTALAEKRETLPLPSLTKTDPHAPAFFVRDRKHLFVKAGTMITIEGRLLRFDDDTECQFNHLIPGADYMLTVAGDLIVSVPATSDLLHDAKVVGGFHYALGGNADARTGGDDVPAINPFSIWDTGFRPSCPDPRGMSLVACVPGSEGVRPFWADIYLLGVDHLQHGTSAFGQAIADGEDLPKTAGGGMAENLNYYTAKAIMEQHGKGLMSFAEYSAFAYGGTEKSACGKDPKTTKLDAARTSRSGGMQAFGSLWAWGHDGDPDEPRASFFGGSWGSGSDAGSRCAGVDIWPGDSGDWVSARGRSDHLQLA